ncbi:MAG: glycine cleavage system aminomethyltransferase GcvT [Thermodesulfobacteriota bacterium]
MSDLKRTLLYDRHVALKAKIVEFAGWEMPVFYPSGIVAEHLATRRGAGLFDVSHMGRFIFRGRDALGFLQHSLTNNAAALEIGQAQYTIIPHERGGAVDDAYLYRFVEDEYLLVVNAANREKDWDHFQGLRSKFPDVEIKDASGDLAMLALQGPDSRSIITAVVQSGSMPEPRRNELGIVNILGTRVWVGRTGYTGEPICFELFVPREAGAKVWDLLLEKGATPVGLGARDTLRLEAGLPLYGHELGQDPGGAEIPILACPLGRVAVSFSPLKGEYVGREALARQFEALKRILRRDYTLIQDLPRLIQPLAMTGRGVARAGAKVFQDGRLIGYVTSGTTAPMWVFQGEGLESRIIGEQKIRAIGLALLDSDIVEDDRIEVDIRGKLVEAVVVSHHLRGEAPPHARPILHGFELPFPAPEPGDGQAKARRLLEKALDNTAWRQRQCVNLIPSEMTASPMTRLLSIMDPSFRYAEHRKLGAFYEAEVFYYQGTDFIAEVERLLQEELKAFLGCPEVETRLISGQMANMAVFSALVDYLNRTDRKREPERLRLVMNNHIGQGGHLSAQPMGALKDFVRHDPRLERPAVINFPVRPEDRFRIDLPRTLELIDAHRPQLLIFGKSMVLYKEPVAEIREHLNRTGLDAVIMYDMAHVLGLVGPHFQKPFEEGADLVTGSTHKTFFGTQRGLAGGRFKEDEERYRLWEALVRRTFPGSVSNHHLGTLLGLLMAAYEMNHFKDDYQPQVLANAKALARALADCGLKVAGDPALGFTETHQVIVNVGYAHGPETARRLEENNIICNYQAAPDEEGFTASGALRLGVSEMTRFGMKEDQFRDLAQLMADVILRQRQVKAEVIKLREPYRELHYCFRDDAGDGLMEKLHSFL